MNVEARPTTETDWGQSPGASGSVGLGTDVGDDTPRAVASEKISNDMTPTIRLEYTCTIDKNTPNPVKKMVK